MCASQIATELCNLDHITGQSTRARCGRLALIGQQMVEQLHLDRRDRDGGVGIRCGSVEHGHPEDPPGQNTEDGNELYKALSGLQSGLFSLATGFQDLVEDLYLPAHGVPIELLDGAFVGKDG